MSNTQDKTNPFATDNFKRWGAYTLGMFFFLYAFVQRVAPSVMTEELMRDLQVGATRLGILSGAYFYTYAVLQLPIGLLVDRFGARRLLSAAALTSGIASAGFAFSDTLLAATVFRALTGAAVAFAFVGTLSILSSHFAAHRFSLLAGILQTMGMVGAIAGQAPLRWMIEQRGWDQVFRDLGWVAVVLALALFFVVPKRRQAIHRPDKSSVHPQKSLTTSLKHVLGNRQSWYCALFGFGMAAPMLAFAGLWAIPWVSAAYDFEPGQAAGIVAWLFIGWGLAAPLAGWLSDFQGKRKPVQIAGALLALVALCLLIYLPDWSPASLRMLFFAAGCGGSTMIVLFSSVRELNDPDDGAAAMGFANMFVVGSGGILQALLGWRLDVNRVKALVPSGEAIDALTITETPVYSAANYSSAFILLIISSVLAVIAAMLIRETGSGRIKP